MISGKFFFKGINLRKNARVKMGKKIPVSGKEYPVFFVEMTGFRVVRMTLVPLKHFYLAFSDKC